MAEANFDPCCCAICLDPLNDPVTIPCGHSFCMSCISSCWEQEGNKVDYSCPQCRELFNSKPVLKKNVVLAELVEKLTTNECTPPNLTGGGLGDVECDLCTRSKAKAVKSCLTCMASYCETHIQPHYESAALKKHNLANATSKLHENICPHHHRLLEVFCRTDGRCICALCTIDEHRGHDIVTLAAEMPVKQTQFEETRNKCQEMIKKRDKELVEMNKAFLSYKRDTEVVEQRCEKVFTELMECVKKTHKEVREGVREEQMEAESEAKDILKELKLEMAELKRREAEMEQLSQEADHVHFLQAVQLMPTSYETKDFQPPHLSFDFIKETISEVKNEVDDFCSNTEEKFSTEVATIFFEVEDFNKLSGRALSPSVILENMSWSAFVRPHLENTKFVSFCLDASSDIGIKCCNVKAVMKVINHQDDDESFVRKIKHSFCAKKPSWGFLRFMSWNDVVDPAKGFVQDDKVSFMVTLWAI